MAEVKCPNCGAPVNGEPGAMACPYCGSRVDIPLVAETPRAVLPEERPDERNRARKHDRYDEDEEAERTTSSSSATSAMPVVIVILGVVGVIGAISFVAASKSRSKKSAKDERKTATTAPATTTTTTTTAKKKPSLPTDNVAIPSCRCAFGDGQSTPLVTLTLRTAPLLDPSRPFDLRIERKNGFVTESGSSILSMPQQTALSPNDAGASAAHLGVACDPGVYVLVADTTATGWSSIDATWKWSTTLPGAMIDGADAGAPIPPHGAGFAPFCTPLTTQNGNATLTLANGRHATLSLKDGKLR